MRSDFIGNRSIDPIANIVDASVDGRVKFEGNIIAGDLTPERITLAANSATPNTANAKTVVTANTSATTITGFNGGYIGKEMVLIVNDGIAAGLPSNTTIQHGTNVFLTAGKSTLFRSGDILMFRASSGSMSTSGIVWYQTDLASGTSPKLGTRVVTTAAAFSLTPGTDLQTQILNVAAGATLNITPSTTSAADCTRRGSRSSSSRGRKCVECPQCTRTR